MKLSDDMEKSADGTGFHGKIGNSVLDILHIRSMRHSGRDINYAVG